MKSSFKHFLFTMLVLLALFPVALWMIATVLDKKIKEQIIKELNKQLVVPIQVRGNIRFSLLHHFPKASLQFEHVEIENKLKIGEKYLAEVEHLSLLFSLSDVIKKKFIIHSVVLKNGSVNILLDKNGQSNLTILKRLESGTPSDVEVQLNNVSLSNMRIRYTDLASSLNINSRIRNLQLKGNLLEKNTQLRAEGNFFIEVIETAAGKIIANKAVVSDMVFTVRDSWRQINLEKSSLIVENNPFVLNGTFVFGKDKTNVLFHASTQGDDVSELIKLLPQHLRKPFVQVKGSGAFDMNISLQGDLSRSQIPPLLLQIQLKDANVELPKVNRTLQHVFAQVEYANNFSGSDYLKITDCRSVLGNESFRFSLFLKNLKEPEWVIDANGTLHLTELGALVPDSVMKNLVGRVLFQNFTASGHFRDLQQPAATIANGSGVFFIKDAGFEANGWRYENINGNVSFQNKNLLLKNFSIRFLNSEMMFNGNVYGLAEFVTALVQRSPVNPVVLHADGELKINQLNLSYTIETFSKKQQTSRKEKLDIKNVFKMEGDLSVNIQQLIYQHMRFDDVKISLTLSPLHLRLNRFSTHTMGGIATGNGYFVFTGDNDLLMNIGTELSDMDITQVFEQTENFGQTTLTAQHISGIANAKVYLKALWKNYKNFDPDHLNAIVDFEIKNGRLKNFEPVKAASKFIRVEELSDIKFSDIKNRLTIYHRAVLIPAFEVKSNAVNLIVSGEHRFDNTIDYRFKINLRRLLANKFNRAGREQYIENDPYDGLNIYLSMTGSLAQPLIRYDKATAAQKMKEDWQKEKEALKKIFTRLPPQATTDKQEEKYFKIEDQPVFMDFDEKP